MSIRITRRLRLRARLPSLAAVLCLLAGLGLTTVLFLDMCKAEQARSRAEFLQQAAARITTIGRSFNDALGVLQAVNALFVSVGEVSAEQFHAFAAPLLDTHPYIQALAVHRIVDDAQRATYEAARRTVDPGFQVRERRGGELAPAATRARYLVVDDIEPLRGNRVMLGYDAFSYQKQRDAFLRAVDAAGPVSTTMLPLLQSGGRNGIVVLQPFYRPRAPPADVATRRLRAAGDTAVVIDVAAMAAISLRKDGLLDRAGPAIELLGPDNGRRRLAFLHEPVAGAIPAWLPWLPWLNGDAVRTVHRFEVAGQEWELHLRGRPTSLASATGPLLVLFLGLLVSLATAAYVQSRVERTRRIEATIARRSADLYAAQDVLRLYRRAIDASANAVLLISATGPGYPIVYVNPAFERMRGYTADEVLGHGLLDPGDGKASQQVSQQGDSPALAELHAAIRTRREGHAAMALRCKDGRILQAEVYIAPVNDQDGNTTHFVMTQYDVTTAKGYEAELEKHARLDTLTALPNRSLLHDRIEGALNFSAGRAPVWVAALDLDHFKFVNDSLGHQAGDRLLVAAARRIAGVVERSDTVARTGGDEFVLVLPGRGGEGEAAATVRAVLAALAHPLELDGQSLVLTASAGVAAFPQDGNDAETLIQHAEVAMYRAKEAGRNALQFYTPSMNARARERLVLETALRHALVHDEFELHYQPQVNLASGSVVGVEALIRWHHPSLGLVRPDRFITLAEETGLIVPIGAWVLRTACRQHREWLRNGVGPLRVAVNLSARQFAEPALVRQIARVLEETGMPPAALEIEITESLVMDDVEGAIRTMGELKRMGVKLSMDDFGTGYSSLSYLRRFPVDVLKIDRSFVRDVASSADDAAMVAAIIELARGLRMRTIAEGVETEAQLDYLKLRGCDEVQGHVYAEAASGAALGALLRTGRRVEPHTVSG